MLLTLSAALLAAVASQNQIAPIMVLDSQLSLENITTADFTGKHQNIVLARLDPTDDPKGDGTLTLLTDGRIEQSFLNQLPETAISFFGDSLAYI